MAGNAKKQGKKCQDICSCLIKKAVNESQGVSMA